MSNDLRANFYEALSRAQGAIEGAIKNNTNPHFRSKYADLGAVWDACRGHLAENGLAILQFPDFDKETGTVCVETIITHKSGFDKSFKTRIPATKPDAQGVGSGITYARRYALMAAVGIAPEDDDGNAAVIKANGKLHDVNDDYDVAPWTEKIRNAKLRPDMNKIAQELKGQKDIPDSALKVIRSAWTARMNAINESQGNGN